MCFNNEKGKCIVLWIRKSALNVRVQQCRIHVLFVSLGETSVWSIVLALIWKRCVSQWCCCGVRTGIKQILYIHTYGDGCCSVGRDRLSNDRRIDESCLKRCLAWQSPTAVWMRERPLWSALSTVDVKQSNQYYHLTIYINLNIMPGS